MSSSRSTWKCIRILTTGLICAVTLHSGTAYSAKPVGRVKQPLRSSEAGALIPYVEIREHRVNSAGLSVTNFGMLGSENGGLTDPCTGLAARSLEFPRGSDVEHLFQGALWVGTVKDGDTLVSIGANGWVPIYELMPEPFPDGRMGERTTLPVLRAEPGSLCPDVYFSPDAVSEQDLVARYFDTVTNQAYVTPDPIDGPHRPIGLRITQRTMGWSAAFAKKIIMAEYVIRNLTSTVLDSVYVGLFIDPDFGHFTKGSYYEDDIAGFIGAAPSLVRWAPDDSVQLAWGADNDGDPSGGVFDYASATSVFGVRFLPDYRWDRTTNFNWWVSNGNIYRDWGPNLQTSTVTFVDGNLGTPAGDRAKYSVMKNCERDFDVVEAALNHTADGWLPPNSNAVYAADMADGIDVRYCLSRGPYTLLPGDEVVIPAVLVMGEGFHTDPNHFAITFDPANPEPFRAGLDRSDLVRSAQLAAWLYDTPGVDTDGDGYRGNYVVTDLDTTFFTGDGYPDYQAPELPKAPVFSLVEFQGDYLKVRFNGEPAEMVPDPFSGAHDFEGYAVYLSTTGKDPADFALLGRRDIVNYTRYRWDAARLGWADEDLPFPLEALRILYDSLTWADFGFAFHPDSFATPELSASLRVITPKHGNPSLFDTNFYYFEPFGANAEPDDIALFMLDSAGVPVTDVIRKVYPHATPYDTAYRNNGMPFMPYYEYEYKIDAHGLPNPIYCAVTTFDQGFPRFGVEPDESRLPGNAMQLWPSACPIVTTGDVNESGDISMADIIYLVNYTFKAGDVPQPCPAAADVNCSGKVSITDVVYLVNYLLRGGPAPCDVCTLIPSVWMCP